jgi:thymidylate kinase
MASPTSSMEGNIVGKDSDDDKAKIQDKASEDNDEAKDEDEVEQVSWAFHAWRSTTMRASWGSYAYQGDDSDSDDDSEASDTDKAKNQDKESIPGTIDNVEAKIQDEEGIVDDFSEPEDMHRPLHDSERSDVSSIDDDHYYTMNKFFLIWRCFMRDIDDVKAKIQDKGSDTIDNEKLTSLTKEVEALLNWMQTEDYYKTHGGNGPNWKEGGELMGKYLKMTDSLGIERKNTLIVKFNKICNANLLRKGSGSAVHIEEEKELSEEKSEFSVASAEEESESEEEEEGTEYSSAEPEEPEEKLELEEDSDDDTLSKEQLKKMLSLSRKKVTRKKNQLKTAQKKVEWLEEELETEAKEVERLEEEVKRLEKQEKMEKQAKKKQEKIATSPSTLYDKDKSLFILIAGLPGSGKSSSLRLAMDDYPNARYLEDPIKHVVFNFEGKNFVHLGSLRDKYPGSDSLPYSHQPVKDFLATMQDRKHVIVAEGQRLCSSKFLESIAHWYNFLVIYLELDENSCADRVRERDGDAKEYKQMFLKRVLGSIRKIKESHEVEVINASLPHTEVALAIKNSILAKTS